MTSYLQEGKSDANLQVFHLLFTKKKNLKTSIKKIISDLSDQKTLIRIRAGMQENGFIPDPLDYLSFCSLMRKYSVFLVKKLPTSST